MGLSAIFITVHARSPLVKGEYAEYPLNIDQILAYPAVDDSDHKEANTRIDLCNHFIETGHHYMGGTYDRSTVNSCLFAKESVAEITQSIEDAQDSFMKRAKKNGVVLVM